MSETLIESYFIEPDAVARAFGSRDAALVKDVLRDRSKAIDLIKTHRPHIVKKNRLAKGIEAFVAGTSDPDDDVLNACAAWAILAALADGRPEEPSIEPPGPSFGGLVDHWKQNKVFPKLRKLLRSVDGDPQKGFELPLAQVTATMPSFVYIVAKEVKALEGEANELLTTVGPLFVDGPTGNGEVDTAYEAVIIATWLLEAAERGKSLLLAIDGEL